MLKSFQSQSEDNIRFRKSEAVFVSLPWANQKNVQFLFPSYLPQKLKPRNKYSLYNILFMGIL